MANQSSATVDPRVDWYVDHRGYIHGGFDTPLFAKVKQKHNSRLTSRRKVKIKRSTTDHRISLDADTKEKS